MSLLDSQDSGQGASVCAVRRNSPKYLQYHLTVKKDSKSATNKKSVDEPECRNLRRWYVGPDLDFFFSLEKGSSTALHIRTQFKRSNGPWCQFILNGFKIAGTFCALGDKTFHFCLQITHSSGELRVSPYAQFAPMPIGVCPAEREHFVAFLFSFEVW